MPVIAAIHGWCVGGGVDLITACDIRLASADARFSVRETRLAMVADIGTLQRLPAIVGPGVARELIYTGRDFDAAYAERVGLVNRVLPDREALLAAADWVKLNHHELARLEPAADPADLCRRHGLRGAVITEGARRVRWATDRGVTAEAAPPRVEDLVDTVGAGDAFSAVCLVGLAASWDPATILTRAAAFAADVCRQPGATSADRDLYRREWCDELRTGSTGDPSP